MAKEQQVFLLKGKIQTRTNVLFMFERILSVSDMVIAPGNIDQTERASLTIKQKQEFILQKLYALYDDFYYPLLDILEGNGIVMKRKGLNGNIEISIEQGKS